MPRAVSPEAFRAAFAQETGQVFLELITVSHPDLPDPIRVVYDTQSVVHDGALYEPFPLSITLSAQQPDQVPTARLTIGNVDLLVGQAVRTLQTRPVVDYRLVLRSQPDTIEVGPLEFEAVSADYDAQAVVLTLAPALKLLTEPHPYLTVNPQSCPGAF